jgi:hypothetical protein
MFPAFAFCVAIRGGQRDHDLPVENDEHIDLVTRLFEENPIARPA